MARQIDGAKDEFSTKLLKLIPSEVSAAFLAINSMVPMDNGFGPEIWGPIVVLAILCPFYLRKLQNVVSWTQTVFTTVAFPIWALNIASARLVDDIDVSPLWLGIILILFTAIAPLVMPKEN